ncbi:right-handed parallel beta-helix repeat-containing protein [Streptomyces sp. NBC_01433]|uniref:right-handed parallel beta-helix repeat-containing protein n=1 Tax=Streptomyces sp. NBC_01433 TaxID=2903864 RepID=UPI0022551C87|nr:right-handed parallel beta-helix repeat-containing protein [Streptomyces sp. NBC_01433]MCX4674836.1 right-handed parallel beta-helix repeat-containing protein [Streptomyces sp. NBC_01433]
MRHRVTAAALAALTAAAGLTAAGTGTAQAAPTGRTHHVDCSATPGATAADGSRARPWTGLGEANAQTYGPGDRLLFRRGATCTGTLAPQGGGSARAPFTIADYGRGSARAKLDGAGAHDVVLLSNTQYVHLKALEITNADNPGSERNGVRLRLTDYGTARGFSVSGLYIHDVRGGDFKTLTGSSAIHIAVEGKAKASRYDGLDIGYNRIENVDREGIYFKSTFSKRDLVGEQQDPNVYPGEWTPSTGVRIHHNTLKSLAGDGMKLDTTSGARVDHNRIDGFQLRSPSANAGVWTFNTDDTTIEYNEVSGGGNTHDGMSFDADGASRNTVFQYNYSHDNKGGFLLICPYSGAKTIGTVARYNVSRNDGARLIQNCWGPILDTRIYNNTFVNSAETVPGYLVQDDAGSPATTQHELSIRNNVFVSEGTGGYALKNPTAGLTFDHNAFYGVDMTRPDPGGITADPKLRPDFRLGKGSPALAAGTVIENNGGKDYFGNKLKPGAPNIGAYAGRGIR